mmetsp:Transcript_24465/g.55712  ORF Transcript_24465/g.55712 Transcript_24465/m.55712 type:complete len:105 (-) Transcript_24465:132-446(-)
MGSLTSAAAGRRSEKVLPGGAVLWAWDADPEFEEAAGEQWLVLLPKKWNPKTQGARNSGRCTAGVIIRASLEPHVRQLQTLVARMPAVLSMMTDFRCLGHVTGV